MADAVAEMSASGRRMRAEASQPPARPIGQHGRAGGGQLPGEAGQFGPLGGDRPADQEARCSRGAGTAASRNSPRQRRRTVAGGELSGQLRRCRLVGQVHGLEHAAVGPPDGEVASRRRLAAGRARQASGRRAAAPGSAAAARAGRGRRAIAADRDSAAAGPLAVHRAVRRRTRTPSGGGGRSSGRLASNSCGGNRRRLVSRYRHRRSSAASISWNRADRTCA